MEKQRYERPLINKISAGVPDKFGMKNRQKTMKTIENIPVTELVLKYGSPLFVISEKKIRNKLNEAKRAFINRYPKVQFAWSYKTNYLDAVCRIFHQEGSWAEVVSGFEYDKAINNGVEGSKIIFNGPGKTEDELIRAINNGSFIHIDHSDELFLINRVTEKCKAKPKVSIRVNMDTGIYPMWDRFGFNYENGEAWNALKRIMLNNKLELVGLHTHIGTYILSPNAYQVAATKLSDLALRLEKNYNHKIKYIDLGGGFASTNTLKGSYLPGTDTCPSFDDYADIITNALINAEFDINNMPVLILETGRALIDEAGYLIGTILANKRLVNGRRAMICDIGINNLFTSFWYQHPIFPVEDIAQYYEDTTLYGPLCMNIDIIRESILLPALNKGDHIVITHVGAYNMTQWWQFITYRPNVVLIDTKGETHLIREKESLEVFKQLEKVPKHLQ